MSLIKNEFGPAPLPLGTYLPIPTFDIEKIIKKEYNKINYELPNKNSVIPPYYDPIRDNYFIKFHDQPKNWWRQ